MSGSPAGPERVLLGLGSNLGDRASNLRRAVDLLSEPGDVHLVVVSRMHETAPVGGPPQPDYLNAAAIVTTTLTPIELLRRAKDVERALGRDAGGERWGPRPVDIDILLFGARIVDEPELTVPHPRMHERRFVLMPAVQLAPTMSHPVLGRTVRQLLEALRDENRT